jgi:predicted acyltransferase
MNDSLIKEPLVRVVSVDILRGLTIFLMVFVNDLGQSAPKWMHHIDPSNADGMTLADIVFPFFLFIAGVSIPLAFEAARKKGHSNLRIFGHIFSRSLALILMGLVEVNRYSEKTLGPELWGLLAFVSITLAWCVIPKTKSTSRTVFMILKVIGIVGLIVMFTIYRSDPVATNVLFQGDVESWTWIRTQWWGILGLIGWAYLVAALIYLFVGSRREWLVGAMGLLMLNFVCAQNGGFFTQVENKAWLEPLLPAVTAIQSIVEFVNRYVGLGSQLGSLPATMMAGCILGKVLTSDSDVKTPTDRIRWAVVYAAGLLFAGAMMDTFAGINKIAATPTWCFWCAALATVVWIILFCVIDIREWSAWSFFLRPAGTNPLTAYLLHPILLFALSLTGFGATVRAYSASESGSVAVFGSIAMALAICGLTALIAKLGLRLRV